MIYITQHASPRYPQLSLEDFLSNDGITLRPVILNEANTRTIAVDRLNDRYSFLANPIARTNALKEFNERWEHLRSVPRKDLYNAFFIPKKTGGLRQINAPVGELSAALYELKAIFETVFGADWLYHTAAFAYVKNRSTIDALKRHQTNDSRWFLKLDLHDFFGSTTLDFVMSQFSMIYPFSEVIRIEEGRKELRRALELAFLNGGLPQGTPISPMITNIMMIPIDHKLFNSLNDFDKHQFVYTRYADDFIISSQYSFCFRRVEQHVVDTLKSFGAPFSLNRDKTRYGNRNGHNFSLGLIINKDNDITVGKERKRNFRAMLCSYVTDKRNGKSWPLEDIQVMEGLRNYYHMVEGETIDKLIGFIDEKYGVNVVRMIKADLSA